LPAYYEWRTRSGCYFCFYQRKAEWVGLAERHPELFERAVQIEKKVLTDAGANGDKSYDDYAMKGRAYTWSGGETLEELLERRDEILERHQMSLERARHKKRNLPLVEALDAALSEDDDALPCTVCAL
jgi:nitroimidazol reductase NimA-like FMN-containing flavoprotein (pyridoxamine 5'-phosphate oxidase superfamily)